MLILTAFFGVWGYVAGMLLSVVLIAINKTVNGRRSYLYPLIPFDGPALRSMLFRVLKRDVSTRQGE